MNINWLVLESDLYSHRANLERHFDRSQETIDGGRGRVELGKGRSLIGMSFGRRVEFERVVQLDALSLDNQIVHLLRQCFLQCFKYFPVIFFAHSLTLQGIYDMAKCEVDLCARILVFWPFLLKNGLTIGCEFQNIKLYSLPVIHFS